MIFKEVEASRKTAAMALALLFSMFLLAVGCGGGGGGGGGAPAPKPPSSGDPPAQDPPPKEDPPPEENPPPEEEPPPENPTPVVAFVSPSPGGSLAWFNNDASLPDAIQVSYSTESGSIQTSSFLAKMIFHSFQFDLSGDFASLSQTGGQTSSSARYSPFYKSVIEQYTTAGAATGKVLIAPGTPSRLISDGAGSFLYVVDETSNLIMALAVSDGRTLKELSYSGEMVDFAVDSVRNKAFYTLKGDLKIHVIDGSNFSTSEIGGITEAFPKALEVNAAKGRLYAELDGLNEIKVVNTGSLDVLSSEPTSNQPDFLFASDANEETVYSVQLGRGNSVYKVVVGSAEGPNLLGSLSGSANDVVHAKKEGRLYYSYTDLDLSENRIRSFDLSTGQNADVPGSGSESVLAADDASGRIFALDEDARVIAVISGSGSSIALKNAAADLDVDSSAGALWVLQNPWSIKSSETDAEGYLSGSLTASVQNSFGKEGSASLSFKIKPTVPGGPDTP